VKIAKEKRVGHVPWLATLLGVEGRAGTLRWD